MTSTINQTLVNATSTSITTMIGNGLNFAGDHLKQVGSAFYAASPYIAGGIVATGALLFGANKAYNYFKVAQKPIEAPVEQPVQTQSIAQPEVIVQPNPIEKTRIVNPETPVSKEETISAGRKDLLKAVSTFEKGGVVNYLKSEFGFAKASLYSTARTVANLVLATLSIFAVVTANGRAYFKSCAYGTVTNLGSALIGSLGTVSPHLGTRAYNAAYQSKAVQA